MAAFVPDASLPLTWCFEDEAMAKTDALLRRLKEGDEASVPAHWPIEVTNGLLMAVRRRRISAEKANRFIEDLGSLPIKVEEESPLRRATGVFLLAEQYRLTAYDAAYLDLAIRAGLPLASLDDELRGAALAAGVPLLV